MVYVYTCLDIDLSLVMRDKMYNVKLICTYSLTTKYLESLKPKLLHRETSLTIAEKSTSSPNPFKNDFAKLSPISVLTHTTCIPATLVLDFQFYWNLLLT